MEDEVVKGVYVANAVGADQQRTAVMAAGGLRLRYLVLWKA
jgi:hypothetical protein